MPVDPKTIYLEADEEITSVVDKLRKTEFSKVILVVPKEASLLQSIVNLKLLKRQAENMNKSIALVTADKVGRNLAEKVGIMTAAKIDNDLKIAENYDLPEETEPNFQEETTEPEDSPLESTSEVLYKKPAKGEETAVKTKVAETEEEDIVIKEGEEEVAQAEEETETWGKKRLEEPANISLMPRFPLKKFLLIGSVVLIVLFSLDFVFIPRAKATVMMKAEKKQVALNFTGDKSASLDSDKAIIPSQLVEATKETSKSFQATGQKNVGNKATGTLKVTNCTASAIPLATFSPKDRPDLVYSSGSPVMVNGGCSQKDIVVTAEEPGDQYNGFQGAPFVAVKASQDNILVTSLNGLSGGSNKQVTYVTQGDIDAAKDNLANDALGEARTEFNKKVENLKVIEDSKKEETVSASANPAVNSEASTFNLTLKVSVRALAYNLDDISALIKAEVSRQLGYSKQVIDDGSKDANIKIDSFDLDKGTFSGDITANAYASNKLDEDQIKTQLVGMTEVKALEYLQGMEGVDSANIEFFPSFIKIFPRIKSHVYLSIEVADVSKGN